MTFTLGPLGILLLLSCIAAAVLVRRIEKSDGFDGLWDVVSLLCLGCTWAGIGVAKAFAWLGWL